MFFLSVYVQASIDRCSATWCNVSLRSDQRRLTLFWHEYCALWHRRSSPCHWSELAGWLSAAAKRSKATRQKTFTKVVRARCVLSPLYYFPDILLYFVWTVRRIPARSIAALNDENWLSEQLADGSLGGRLSVGAFSESVERFEEELGWESRLSWVTERIGWEDKFAFVPRKHIDSHSDAVWKKERKKKNDSHQNLFNCDRWLINIDTRAESEQARLSSTEVNRKHLETMKKWCCSHINETTAALLLLYSLFSFRFLYFFV